MSNEIFGPGATDSSVMMGKDYVLSRRAMRILSESVNRIRIEKFKVCHAELLTPLEPLVE